MSCLSCGNVVSPSNQLTVIVGTINKQVKHLYFIVIPRYEYDIVVITRVRGEAEYEC